MDQIFNEPTIKNFLQTIKEQDQKSTLRELVLLGIHAVSAKIHQNGCRGCSSHCGCCGCVKVYRNWQAGPQNAVVGCCGEQGKTSNNNFVEELQQIKNRINQISMACNNQSPYFNNNSQVNALREKPTNIDMLNQHTKTEFDNISITNPGQNFKQFRHHLDDSQVRKVLVNPYAKPSPVKKQQKKMSIEKGHQIQKTIDQQQLKINAFQQTYDISEQAPHPKPVPNKKTVVSEIGSAKKMKRTGFNATNPNEEESYEHNEMKSMKNKSYGGATSKIKSLIEKDKERNKKNAFLKKDQYSKSKYCQFEYSDESEEEQESEQIGEECPVHSNVKQQVVEDSESEISMAQQPQTNSFSGHQKEQRSRSSYEQYQEQSSKSKEWQSFKENRKKVQKIWQKKQQEESSKKSISHEEHEQDDDEVSQSSSFSKFSMSSGRENGKIIGLRK